MSLTVHTAEGENNIMKKKSILKRIQENDLENLNRFIREFIRFNIEKNPSYAITDLDKMYKSNFNWYEERINKNLEVYFILCDGLEVGYLLLGKEYLDDFETYNPGKVGIIEDLFITSEYRRKGLGADAIAEAEKILKEDKCKVIRIDYFAWNSAGELYKNLGYKNFYHRLEKRII